MTQPVHEAAESERSTDIGRGLTVRSLLIAIVLLVLANIWTKYAALITLSSQVAMSVPPIPALIFLILLLALRPLAPRLALNRRELLFIYAFLALSVALTSGGALRTFMPTPTALQYFATPENGWADFEQYQPSWLVVKDPEVVRGYYEGSDAGVPWRAWLVPLASWSLLLLLILGTLLCMAVLLYDEWSQRERLSFQLCEIPLSMTAPQEAGRRIPQLWRDPIMWIGFTAAAVFNGTNILHAFNPAVPALGLRYNLGQFFTDRPWSALSDVDMYHQPDVFGLGYLMPQEVVVSSLLFFALTKLEGVVASAPGYDIPRMPFQYSQSAGAFVAFGVYLLYMARHRLKAVFSDAFVGRGQLGEKWAAWGVAIGLAGIVMWGLAAGLSALTIALFFGILLLMALTYCRMRAETGMPLQWGYPVSQANIMLTSAFGGGLFMRHGGMQNLTTWFTGWFLTRGYLPNLSAYHFEGLRIADEGGIARREMVVTLLLAMVLGMAASYWMQLDAAYSFGANFLEGGTHGGGMRVAATRYGFAQLAEASRGGLKPIPGEAIAVIWGMVATITLTVLRTLIPRFPLHHLGFVIGTTRGHQAWSGLALAAALKSLAIRLGGVGLYRRLVPAAIGVVIGHFVVSGGIWSIAAVFGGEAYRSYQVWFG